MLSFVDTKHAIVYFCIICKLIKKSSFFFLMKMFIVWQKVASYSEYLVEVDFLRIYTHINIYCKSISFCLNSLRLSDWYCSWTDNMHGFFSWVTLSFLFCAWKPREVRNCSVFFFLRVSSFPPRSVLSFPTLFMPAYILYLYTLSFLSFFCHCNLYQQSRCLNNANPFFIQSRVQFSTLTTIVYCHRGIHGNLGTKHKPTLFGGEARLEYKEP